MRILIICGQSESGFGKIGKLLNNMFNRNKHDSKLLDNYEGNTLDAKLDIAEESFIPDIIITIQDMWNLEWLQHRIRNWCWIMYCPIEGEDIPQYAKIGSKKIDLIDVIHTPDFIVAYNTFGAKELNKIRQVDSTIEHVIDKNYYYDPELKKKAKEIMPELVFGYVGLNIPRKGIDTLLGAWDKIKYAFKTVYDRNCKLIIHTMDTDLSPPVSEMVYACKDSSSIIISNQRLDSEEMKELYHTMDIFLSFHNAEGFGMPILEAMLCGCYVITNNYAGPSSIYDRFVSDSYRASNRMRTISTDIVAQDVSISWKRKYPNLSGICNPDDPFYTYLTEDLSNQEKIEENNKMIHYSFGEERIMKLWNKQFNKLNKSSDIRITK